MNQHQVGIAESTCSAVFTATSVAHGGSALLSINALSQIALERARTAREAVLVMGELSEKFGFYGASSSMEGGGESLIVTDTNEGWVFHILADPTGTSSIWVAARVPDGHVAVVANMFSIRTVDLSDTANFLGRTDMWDIAQQHGLWTPGQVKDWTATFSDGEYAHKYYSGRRMWAVLRLVSPNTSLAAEYNNLKMDAPYPFSVPVTAAEAGPELAFRVMRDFYNATEFNLSSHPAGGPFGTPDRFGGQEAGDAVPVSGNWERAIGLFRTAESYVLQTHSFTSVSKSAVRGLSAEPKRGGLGSGVVWFGAHAALYTVYTPVLSGGLLNVPTSLSRGWQGVYDLSTNFWASRSLALLAQVKWNYMMPAVQALQGQLERASLDLVQNVMDKYEAEAMSLKDVESVLSDNAGSAVSKSLELFHKLVFKYADGFVNTWVGDGAAAHFTSSSPGYPGWWLQSVGYPLGPPPV